MKRFLSVACMGLLSVLSPAKSYAVNLDCALFLCIPGGFPASGGICSSARQLMIQRVTPWPVSPPWHPWRCPMGISSLDTPLQSQRVIPASWTSKDQFSVIKINDLIDTEIPQDWDFDMNSIGFNPLPTFRVLRYDYRRGENKDGDCVYRLNRSYFGRYSAQGEYYETKIQNPHASIPSWIAKPSNSCNELLGGTVRAVGLEWQDMNGEIYREVIRY